MKKVRSPVMAGRGKLKYNKCHVLVLESKRLKITNDFSHFLLCSLLDQYQ